MLKACIMKRSKWIKLNLCVLSSLFFNTHICQAIERRDSCVGIPRRVSISEETYDNADFEKTLQFFKISLNGEISDKRLKRIPAQLKVFATNEVHFQRIYALFQEEIITELKRKVDRFPEEKALPRIIWKCIDHILPFEQGNILLVWEVLKEIHPLSETKAKSVFDLLSDLNFENYIYDALAIVKAAKEDDHILPELIEKFPEDQFSNLIYVLGQVNFILPMVKMDNKKMEKLLGMLEIEKVRLDFLRDREVHGVIDALWHASRNQ